MQPGTLDPADVIRDAVRTYGSYALVLIGTAFGIFLVNAIVAYVAAEVGAGLFILAFVVNIALSTLYQGMVVELVRDVQDGRLDQSVPEMFRRVAPVVLPLILVGFVAGLGIAVGLLLLIVPGLFLLTIWAVFAPVIVVERRGLDALSRSADLTKGNRWQVFAVILLAFFIGLVITAVAAAISGIGGAIIQLLLQAATAPLTALLAAVLYFKLAGRDTAAAVADEPWAPPAT
jgi:hypothetical protein